MNTSAFIDLYCERTGPGFWDEPFNALSNAAFLMAAVVAWHTRRRRVLDHDGSTETSNGDNWELMLIILAAAVGAGSFLFHTFASAWAERADVIPIWLFVGSYILLSIYRNTGQDAGRTWRIGLMATASTLLITGLTGDGLLTSTNTGSPLPFNGSLQYTPALAALAAFTAFAWLRHHPVSRYMLMALLVFSTALLFRTIDIQSCEWTQGIGTHFLWHLLNALLIGLLLRAMLLKMPPQR